MNSVDLSSSVPIRPLQGCSHCCFQTSYPFLPAEESIFHLDSYCRVEPTHFLEVITPLGISDSNLLEAIKEVEKFDPTLLHRRESPSGLGYARRFPPCARRDFQAGR